MNIVSCNSDCEYQIDGYCYLKKMQITNNSQKNKCCYYKEKSINSTKSQTAYKTDL